MFTLPEMTYVDCTFFFNRVVIFVIDAYEVYNRPNSILA